jgi:hypothetical protein
MSCRILQLEGGKTESGLSVSSTTIVDVPQNTTTADFLSSVVTAHGGTMTGQRLVLFVQQGHFPLRPCSAGHVITAAARMVAVAYPATFVSDTADKCSFDNTTSFKSAAAPIVQPGAFVGSTRNTFAFGAKKVPQEDGKGGGWRPTRPLQAAQNWTPNASATPFSTNWLGSAQ